MDYEERSVTDILKENFKREIPRTAFGMVEISIHGWLWRVITGAVAAFVVWLVFGDLFVLAGTLGELSR